MHVHKSIIFVFVLFRLVVWRQRDVQPFTYKYMLHHAKLIECILSVWYIVICHKRDKILNFLYALKVWFEIRQVLPRTKSLVISYTMVWFAFHQAWWRNQMETFSALLSLRVGNSPVTAQRPITRSFGVSFDLRLNERLSKNREAGDLRRHRVHYDATVMFMDDAKG